MGATDDSAPNSTFGIEDHAARLVLDEDLEKQGLRALDGLEDVKHVLVGVVDVEVLVGNQDELLLRRRIGLTVETEVGTVLCREVPTGEAAAGGCGGRRRVLHGRLCVSCKSSCVNLLQQGVVVIKDKSALVSFLHLLLDRRPTFQIEPEHIVGLLNAPAKTHVV